MASPWPASVGGWQMTFQPVPLSHPQAFPHPFSNPLGINPLQDQRASRDAASQELLISNLSKRINDLETDLKFERECKLFTQKHCNFLLEQITSTTTPTVSTEHESMKAQLASARSKIVVLKEKLRRQRRLRSFAVDPPSTPLETDLLGHDELGDIRPLSAFPPLQARDSSSEPSSMGQNVDDKSGTQHRRKVQRMSTIFPHKPIRAIEAALLAKRGHYDDACALLHEYDNEPQNVVDSSDESSFQSDGTTPIMWSEGNNELPNKGFLEQTKPSISAPVWKGKGVKGSVDTSRNTKNGANHTANGADTSFVPTDVFQSTWRSNHTKDVVQPPRQVLVERRHDSPVAISEEQDLVDLDGRSDSFKVDWKGANSNAQLAEAKVDNLQNTAIQALSAGEISESSSAGIRKDVQSAREQLTYLPAASDKDVYRAVLVTGIKPGTPIMDIMAVVCGGSLVSITYNHTACIYGVANTALLTFLHESSARNFVSHASTIKTTTIAYKNFYTTASTTNSNDTDDSVKYILLPTPTFPLGHEMRHQIHNQGYTRLLCIHNLKLHPRLSLHDVKLELSRSSTAHDYHTIMQISANHEDSLVYVEFMSIAAAARGVECFNASRAWWFRDAWITFMKDPCDKPAPGVLTSMVNGAVVNKEAVAAGIAANALSNERSHGEGNGVSSVVGAGDGGDDQAILGDSPSQDSVSQALQKSQTVSQRDIAKEDGKGDSPFNEETAIQHLTLIVPSTLPSVEEEVESGAEIDAESTDSSVFMAETSSVDEQQDKDSETKASSVDLCTRASSLETLL